MLRRLTSFLLLTALVPLCTRAALTRIDADGVTETGGSPAFSRMIPRTGADGRLSSTLLPPVADWASQPLPGLYYLSDGADREGNGSPQYPFRTLTNAWAHATGGSAVLLAPGTYAGSVTLPAGQTRTLYGLGAPSAVSALTVTAGGVSPATELRLCSVRVGTLTLHGGTVTVRLCNAVVDVLAGSAAAVTVVRTDLGSSVGTHTRAYTDSYAGYSTVPNARQVVSTDGTSPLTVSAGRPHVGTETGAYLSDLTAATTTVYTTIGTLTAEDTRLAGLVATEAVNRASADAVLSQVFSTGITALSNDVAAIGTGWNTQLSALNGTVSFLGTSLANLWTTETNDVAELQAGLLATASNATLANAALEATLRSEFTSGLTALRTDVPGLAATAADTRILFHSNALVQAAVRQADSNATVRLNALDASVTDLQSRVTDLEYAVASNATDIAGLKSADETLRTSLAGLRTKESNDVVSLRRELANVTTNYTRADTYITNALIQKFTWELEALSNYVPVVCWTQAAAVVAAARPSIIEAAVTQAVAAAVLKDASVSNAFVRADNDLRRRIQAVSNEVTRVDTRLTIATNAYAAADRVLYREIKSITNDINRVSAKMSNVSNALVRADSILGAQIRGLTNEVKNCYALTNRIVTLETWKTKTENWKSSLNGTNNNFRAKINELIRAFNSFTNQVHLTPIIELR